MISITRVQKLTDKHCSDLKELYSDYNYSDKYSFSDEDEYFLLYENNILSTVLTLFYPDENTCECKAYSKKSFRRRGNFLVLLGIAKELISARETVTEVKTDFLIVVPENPESDSLNTLDRITATYYYSEYIMAYTDLQHKVSVLCTEDSSEKIRLTGKDKDGTCHIILGNNPIGIFSYNTISGNSIYFYDYYIAKKFRGKGYGYLCLKHIINHFASRGLGSIQLQVSELNVPAMTIYKKAGFLVKNTLSFYKY